MKHLTVVILLALQALLSACAVPPSGAGRSFNRDFLGNRYPAECADLSGISVPIIKTDNVVLWKNGEAAGLYGGWTPRYIMVRKGLDAATTADVIRHELTHECMWRLHGDPKWH